MVISQISQLSLDKRERFFSQLDHELRGPLRKINAFCGIIYEDEKGVNSSILEPLRNLSSLSASLSEKLKELMRAGSEQELKESWCDLAGIINQFNEPLPENLIFNHSDSPDHYQKINLFRRRIVYTYRCLFDLGEREHFSFRVYVKLFPFLYQEALAERKISFTDKTESFPFETETRAYELVLENLLGNAITHGFPGSVSSSCDRRINITSRGNYAPYLVLIEDNGAGIDTARISQQAVERGLIVASDLEGPVAGLEQAIEQQGLYLPKTSKQYIRLGEEEQQRFLLNQLVFLPKMTTSEKETEAVHGTAQGIGLALVKSLVEENGGKVWVYSKQGETKFYFTIPQEKVVNYRG